MRKTTFAIVIALGLVAAACGGTAEEAPTTLKLIAHDSFVGGLTDETFSAFAEETGIAVEVIAAGDTGTLVNQAILSKDNPLADVLFGVDDTFLSRALDEAVFEPFESSLIASVKPELLEEENRVTPIDFGDVCINYDRVWFEDEGLAVPTDLEDLRREDYARLLTVEHPATSSPGLAFMLATIAEYGEGTWLDFWRDLRDEGVNIAADWDAAYYGDFTRWGGETPMVVSYASSPPAEVIFSEEPTDSAPTGIFEPGCYRQVEYAGVLAGTPYPDAAGRLIDFMLSVEFQEGIPLTWFVFPANREAALPQEFVDHTVIPANPARLSADDIAENRERWINEWIEVMEG